MIRIFPAIVILAVSLSAAELPEGFIESVLATGLSKPVSMAIAPDGRVFICEQDGCVRVWKAGVLLPDPFLSVQVDSSGDRGLMGIALDPDFNLNHYVYILHTVPAAPIHNAVSRFTADGDIAAPGSQTILFHLSNLSSIAHHCDGSLAFGADGKLYIGAPDNTNGANAQSMSTLLGKLLRINPDGTIPSDNPFYDSLSGDLRAIWAIGLRNPFTFAIQCTSGRTFINDVGLSTWEEINDGAPGANFGWPSSEGATSNPAHTSPLFVYGHGSGPAVGCAITGGAFYNPEENQFPVQYSGRYFYMDYCGRWIRYLDPADPVASQPFAANIGANPVTLRVGPNGSLFYLSRGATLNAGSLRRIHYAPAVDPVISQQPQDQTVFEGDPAAFAISALGAAPFSYQWQRDGADIPGATAASLSLGDPQLSDDGAAFRCIVRNAYGEATSNSAILSVLRNLPPVVTILTPEADPLFISCETVDFCANAADPEDGPLDAQAFTWRIEQLRGSNAQPLMEPLHGVTGGSITLPASEPPDINVFYRFTVTVCDSRGLGGSAVREIYPRLAAVKLETVPAGLALQLDGASVVAPFEFTAVTGCARAVSAPQIQRIGAQVYDFSHWSDGGGRAHEITTPAESATLSAIYVLRPAPQLGGISVSPDGTLEAGEPVTLSCTAHSTAPLLWAWTLGDGSESTQAGAVTHSYSNPGTYAIALTVTDDAGQLTQTTVTLQVVQAGGGSPPGPEDENNATPTAVQPSPCERLNVTSFASVVHAMPIGRDSIRVKANLGNIAAVLDRNLDIQFGKASLSIQLDARNTWRNAGCSVSLRTNRRTGGTSLSVRLSQCNLCSEGLAGTAELLDPRLALPVGITFAGRRWQCMLDIACVTRGTTTRLLLAGQK